MAYILVVDDEVDLCEILQFNLETEGHDVDVAYSAEEALEKNLKQYDLLLLDVMMGEISGFKMARMLQDKPDLKHIPIVFLTARDTENDIITGFNLGADDYIAKPFSIREVILRIRAVLKRATHHAAPAVKPEVLQYKTLSVQLDQKKVYIKDREVQLTKKEFEILHLLLSNLDRVYSREEILKHVWTDDVCVIDRTVDVNITRMRRKIAPYDQHIVTRLGYGYVFETKG